MVIKSILSKEGLSFKENRVFKIFNFVLLATMVIILAIAIFLLTINAISSFWICLGEIVIFYGLLHFHIKGHFDVTRYIFFLFAITMQVYGSLYHGENGGFDFLFFATSLSPVLFFEKRWQILSIFILSTATYITVKFLYDHVEPVMPLDREAIPYYANFIISSLLLYAGYRLFKSEHLKYEEILESQKNKISGQKEALYTVKTQLEKLLQANNQQMKEQNKSIAKYAYLNSHKARSPLARILGLVNLTKYEDLADEEKRRYYFDELSSNAKELDNILKEISEVLDQPSEVR